MKITKSRLKEIIKEALGEVLNEDDTLGDFWMDELNSALIYSMQDAGIDMAPSQFLSALLPVLHAYGVGEQAEEMVAHVRSNQDIYSPRHAGGGLGGASGKARNPSAEEIAAAGGTPYMEDLELSEDTASREDIAALRQRVGNMSYEIERMLVSLIKAGYSMEDIMQMASELKRMDPHPADVQVAERKLSKSEEKEKEKVVKGMKKSKKDFKKRYGDDAESVMYATATKMAKKKKE